MRMFSTLGFCQENQGNFKVKITNCCYEDLKSEHLMKLSLLVVLEVI